MSTPTHPPLLTAEGLAKEFILSRNLWGQPVRRLQAVQGVSFNLQRGTTLGLVGESGSGKTTLGKLILRLLEPTAGRILLEGTDITHLGEKPMKAVRKKMQVIFQDPHSALNPARLLRFSLMEPLVVHQLFSEQAACERRLQELLDYVQLPPAVLEKYPHELSGGQKQRVCIARALATNPAFIICDESVSALDVSIQAQILNLLQELQEQLHLTYLFISHDLDVVAHVADEIAVMYLGEIVEFGSTEAIYHRPQHPYTQRLLAARPRLPQQV